jgi:hypothetical protein
MPRRRNPDPKPRGRPKGFRVLGEQGCRVCQHPEFARINFLCASGGEKSAIAAQFGLPYESVRRHHQLHISSRYKKMIGASRLESFEALVSKAVEGGAETLDLLDLLVRGHSTMWSVALDSGSGAAMVQHANKILAATELRAKVTRELVPGPTVQVNNYLLRDAAQLIQILEHHPEAADAVLRWHQQRSTTRVIEYAEHTEHAAAD